VNLLKNRMETITIPTPFSVGDVNVYLIKGDALTLIDVGPKTEEAWNVFKQKLKELGYVPEDIEQVVLTHHHPDHVGLLDFFPKDLPVLGHPYNERWLLQEKSFLEERRKFFTELFKVFGVDNKYFYLLKNIDQTLVFSCKRPLTSSITEGEEIKGLSGLKVIETPGHAQSHIVLYNEKTCEMLGGDHLLKHISSNPLLEPPISGSKRPKPLLQYNESLKKLLEIPISVVYSGHGEPVYNAHNLIEHRLMRQHERAMSVLSFLNEEDMTAFEICKKLFPAVYERELMLTMSETIGQLDYLEDLNLITYKNVDGVRIYGRA